MSRDRRGQHRLEAAAAAVVGGLARRLPWRMAAAVGGALGGAWGALDRRHLAIALDNLGHAFPAWDHGRRLAVARGVYRHFGRVLLEILWMAGRSREQVLALVDVEGAEHVESARAGGRGALLVTAHIGNWELHGLAHGLVFGPLHVIARPLDNPRLDARLCAARTQGGNRVIPKRHALASVLRAMRAGETVAVLIDQNVQEKDGIFVDFLGRPAATTTVAAAVALKTGCALVPAHSERQPDGRYRLVYEAPLTRPASGERQKDVAALTAALTDRIADWVRRVPDQWLWIHRRWKTQPLAGTATEAAS